MNYSITCIVLYALEIVIYISVLIHTMITSKMKYIQIWSLVIILGKCLTIVGVWSLYSWTHISKTNKELLLACICMCLAFTMQVCFIWTYVFKYFRVSQILLQLNHMKPYNEKCITWFNRAILMAIALAYLPYIPLVYLFMLKEASPTITILYWCLTWI